MVNTFNKDEDMSEEVMALDPCRWKVGFYRMQRSAQPQSHVMVALFL